MYFILVQFRVGEDHFAFHALFEIVPRISTRLKFLIVLLQVLFIEARWALILLILLGFLGAFFQFALKQSLFIPWLQRSAHLVGYLPRDINDRLLPPGRLSLVFEQFLGQ